MTVEEGYSVSGTVIDNQWSHVAIRFVNDSTLNQCDLSVASARTGTLMFYVNGKLKYSVNNFKEFIAKSLFEHREKKEGVAYNMSIGGGSQGLLESITFDGDDPEDKLLPIEQNFAGTFIGDISQFRYYIEDVDFCSLNKNYAIEASRYDVSDCRNDLLLQEDDFIILQENGYELKWL